MAPTPNPADPTDPSPAAATVPAAERPKRPKGAPVPPDDESGTQGATKEQWEKFRKEMAGWIDKASDADLLAMMAHLPVAGRPLSPWEQWAYHECELRRRPPSKESRGAGRNR